MRDFVEVLADLDSGEVHNLCTEQLGALVAAVVATKKKGTLTLTLEVKPEGEMAFVKAKVTAKLPVPETTVTAFFPTEDGGLHRHDPKAEPLRKVKAQAGEALRTVKEAARE